MLLVLITFISLSAQKSVVNLRHHTNLNRDIRGDLAEKVIFNPICKALLGFRQVKTEEN